MAANIANLPQHSNQFREVASIEATSSQTLAPHIHRADLTFCDLLKAKTAVSYEALIMG